MDFRILEKGMLGVVIIAYLAGCQATSGLKPLMMRRSLPKTQQESINAAVVQLASKKVELNKREFEIVTDRKLVDLGSDASIRAVLAGAYPTGGFRSFQGDQYHDQWAALSRGSVTQFIPIGLIERHEIGDYQVRSGDALAIKRSESTIIDTKDPSRSGRVVVAGLVPKPGTYRLNAEATLKEKTVEAVLERAGLFDIENQMPDLIVLTRKTGIGLSQTFIPIADSETYQDDGDALEMYKRFERTFLQDGDLLEVTNLSLLASVVEGRMARRIIQNMPSREISAPSSNTTSRLEAASLSTFFQRFSIFNPMK